MSSIMVLSGVKGFCALEADDAWVVIILKKDMITLISTFYEKLNDSAIIFIDVASEILVSRTPVF